MGEVQRKYEAHMLTWAIANDGRFVNVDDVKTGLDCNCVCPACIESLIAKNRGLARVHLFAHKSGSECALAYESMLHLLAKERVQRAFLNADCFLLVYDYRSYCQSKCRLMISETDN